ncbi:MAG TPA: YceI family protein [Candidatus Acidoferrum sp.]|nr:YceI family protein [Candidatus Acidoferrum sp.]
MRIATFGLLAAVSFPSITLGQSPSGVPVFEVTPLSSNVKFEVKASVAIRGKFDKWGATLTFESPDVSTGVLEINIQAGSVDTGSGMKNRKLKGKDFFDVEKFPQITFKSTKIVQISHEHFEVDGDLTIRGVSNPEKLTLAISHKESHLGDIHGKMVFDRKQYGMNKGIPFISIADHVEINIHLKTKHTGGPQLAGGA